MTNPEFNKNSPDVSSGVYNSGESVNNVVFKTKPTGNPESLIASNGLFTDKITLTWGSVDDAVNYQIYRNEQLIAETNISSYEDTAVTSLSSYSYFVKAFNGITVSDRSNEDLGWLKLQPPTNLTATSGTFNDRILLGWNYVVGATSYTLYRGKIEDLTTDIDINLLTEIVTTSFNSYEDKNFLTVNQEYFYVVVASSDLSTSDISDYAVGKTTQQPAKAPINLIATNGEFTDKVLVSWIAVEPSVDYYIYRSGILLGITKTTSFEDTTAIPGTAYYYNVKAKNNIGFSTNNDYNQVGWRKLEAPKNLNATDALYESQINLTWSSSFGATSYKIYRSTEFNTNSMQLIATIAFNDPNATINENTNSELNTSYTDSDSTLGLDYYNGKKYYYTVKASSSLGDSDFSVIESGSLKIILPDAVRGVSASDGSYTDKVRIEWRKADYAAQYEIYRNGIRLITTQGTIKNQYNQNQLGNITVLESEPITQSDSIFSLYYDDKSAVAGTLYEYSIVGKNQRGLGEYATDSINTGWKKLSAPANLIVSNGSYINKILVSWGAVVGATSYKVYRETIEYTPTGDVTVLSSSTIIATTTTNNYEDSNTDLSYNVYYRYRIVASCALGDSNFSVTKVGSLKTPTVSAPTGLTATAGVHEDKVVLNWNDVVNATGYIVYANDLQIATTIDSAYTDSDILAGVQRVYTVKAVGLFETSVSSNSVSGWKKLSAPKNVNASDSAFSNYIEVYWTKVEGATSYKVYRSLNSNMSSSILLGEVVSTNYIDTNTDLVVGTTYYYAVVAASDTYNTNGILDSALSNIDSGRLFTPSTTDVITDDVAPVLPDAPTNVTASDGSFDYMILVNWSSVSNTPITGYKVYRDGNIITATTNNFYQDTSAEVLPGKNYSYSVIAYNLSGNSLQSSPNIGFKKLLSPTSLTATTSLSDKITLQWNSALGATNYKIYKGTNPSSLILIATTTGTTYNDTSVGFNTNYYYKVTSSTSITESETDVIVIGRIKKPVPATVTRITATSGSFNDKIVLSWDPVANAEEYFVKSNITNPLGSITQFTTTPNTSIEFDSSLIVPGVLYSFSVAGFNTDSGSGLDSPTVTGFASLLAPQNLVASNNEFEQSIRLTWDSVNGATSYKIYRGTGDDSTVLTMTLIATVTDTEYDDLYTDLSYDVVYKYAVKASSVITDSDFSSTDSGYLKIPIPTSFTLVADKALNSNYVELTWTPSTYVTTYKIYRNNVELGIASSNYLRYSENLNNTTFWKSFGSLIAVNNTELEFPLSEETSSIAGRKITFSSSGSSGLYQTISPLPATLLDSPIEYTFSIYARVKEQTQTDQTEPPPKNTAKFRLSYTPFGGKQQQFSPTFEAGPTIQRFSWTFTLQSLIPQSYVSIENAVDGTGAPINDTVYIFGAQLEKGTIPTSFVSTQNNYKLSTTYQDKTAECKEKYTYYVEAVNVSGTRTSNTDLGYLKPIAPTNLTASNNNQNKITLEWDNVPCAVQYKIYRGTDTTTFALINQVTATPPSGGGGGGGSSGSGDEGVNLLGLLSSQSFAPDAQQLKVSFEDTTATSTYTYYYYVTSNDNNGESARSNIASGYLSLPVKTMEVVLEEANGDGYWLERMKNEYGIQNSVGGYEGYWMYKERGSSEGLRCNQNRSIALAYDRMVPQRIVAPNTMDGVYRTNNSQSEYGLYGDSLFGLYEEKVINGVTKLVWLKNFKYAEDMTLDDNVTPVYAVNTDLGQIPNYGINFVIPQFIDVGWTLRNMYYDIDTKLDNRSLGSGYNSCVGKNYPKYGWLNLELWHREFSYFPPVYPQGSTYGTGLTPLTRSPNTPYDYENVYIPFPSIPTGHKQFNPSSTWGTNPTGKKYRVLLSSRFMNLGTFGGSSNVVGAGSSSINLESKIIWGTHYKQNSPGFSTYTFAKYQSGEWGENRFTNWELTYYKEYANSIKLKELCSQDLVNAGITPWMSPQDFSEWHTNRRQNIINQHLQILSAVKARYPKIKWSIYGMGGAEGNRATCCYDVALYRNLNGPQLTGKTVYDLWLDGGVSIWTTKSGKKDAFGRLIPDNDADILAGSIQGRGLPLEFRVSENNPESSVNTLLHNLSWGQIIAAQDWLQSSYYLTEDPEDNPLYDYGRNVGDFHDSVSGARYTQYVLDGLIYGLNKTNEWLQANYGITKPTFLYVADCYEPNYYLSMNVASRQNGTKPTDVNRYYSRRIHPKTWKKWIFDKIKQEVNRPGSYITGYAHWSGSGGGGRRGHIPPQSPKMWKLKFESMYVENFPSGSDLRSLDNSYWGTVSGTYKLIPSNELQTYAYDGDYDYGMSRFGALSPAFRDTNNAIYGGRAGDLQGYKRDPGFNQSYFGSSPTGQNAMYYYGKYWYMLYTHCFKQTPLDYWVDPNPTEYTRYFFTPNETITKTSDYRIYGDTRDTDNATKKTRLINCFNTYLKPKYWDSDIGNYINTTQPINPISGGTNNNYSIPSWHYWYDFRLLLNDPTTYVIPTTIQNQIFNNKYPAGEVKTAYNYPPITQYNFSKIPFNCSDRLLTWSHFFAPTRVRKDTVLLHDDRTNRSVFSYKYLKFKNYGAFNWALVDQKSNGEFSQHEFLDIDSLLSIGLRRNFIYLPYGRTIRTNTHSIGGSQSDNRTAWMWGNISIINNLLVDRNTIPYDYLSAAQAAEYQTDDDRDPIYNITYVGKNYPAGTVPTPGFFNNPEPISNSTVIDRKPFPNEPLDIKYLETNIKGGMTTFANNVNSKYLGSTLRPEFIAYMGNVPFGDMFEGETRLKMPLAYHSDPRSAENKEIYIKMLNDATKHWVDNFRSPVDGISRMVFDSAASYPTFYCEFAPDSMTKAPTYSIQSGVWQDTSDYDYRYFYRNTGHLNNFLLWYLGANMTIFADHGLYTKESPYGAIYFDPEKSIWNNEVRNFKIGLELAQSTIFDSDITPDQSVGHSRRRTNSNLSQEAFEQTLDKCGLDSSVHPTGWTDSVSGRKWTGSYKTYTAAYLANLSDIQFCADYVSLCTPVGINVGSWSYRRYIIRPDGRGSRQAEFGPNKLYKYGLITGKTFTGKAWADRTTHWAFSLFNNSDYSPDLFISPYDALETFPNALRSKLNNLNNIALAVDSNGNPTSTNNNVFDDLATDAVWRNQPTAANQLGFDHDAVLATKPEGTLPRSIILDSHLAVQGFKSRDQYGITGLYGGSTLPDAKSAIKGTSGNHMIGEIFACASLNNPSLLNPTYFPQFNNTFTENNTTLNKVVWKKVDGSDLVMTKFFNWISANSTVPGGDFNAAPIDQVKGDIRYWVSEGPNTDRKYWYADSYVNSSSNNLSGLSWSWLRDRRFTIFVLYPLLLRRGLSIITDILSYHSYEPSSSMFMNINYDPNDPNEPLVKPPTKEELLYVFMSAGISNPEMLENFYSAFHVSSEFDSTKIQGLWATTWNDSSLNSNLLVKSFTITGRLSPNPTAGLDETIRSPSDAVTFFNNNNIPEYRRVILPNYLNAGYGDFYWLKNGGYNAATCIAGQPCDKRKSLDLVTNTDDACKTTSGQIIKQTISNDPRILGVAPEPPNPNGYSGSLTFASPWQDATSSRVKTSWNSWLTSYNAAGGKVSYIVGDIIDSENLSIVGFFSEFLRKNPADGGELKLTHFNTIINDPRSTSATAGNAAIHGTFRSQLKLDSGYTTADFNTLDLTTTKGGYKLWNFVTSRLTAFYLNDALYNTTKSIFPSIKLSNYDNTKILESDKLSDLNGHKSYVDNNIGNYVAVALYGEWNAGNIYQIDSTDPTSLVYNPSSSTPFGTTAWNSFAVSQQRLRTVDRNRITDNKQLQVWLASINYYNNNSFGGNTTQHNNYWRENAYHALLRNPDPVLYWNSNSASNPLLEKEMSDAIKEVNNKTNMQIVSTVSSSNEKINYNTTFIVSGCRTRDNINLWRITVDFNKVETVVIDGTTYNLKTVYAINGVPAVGFWYTTNTTKIRINQSNYNSSTKTLTLVSSIT